MTNEQAKAERTAEILAMLREERKLRGAVPPTWVWWDMIIGIIETHFAEKNDDD